MKEKEFYRSAVKVTGKISYVDINHKELGIQEKTVDLLMPDLDENGVRNLFADILEPNEIFIDAEKATIVPGKVYAKFSDLLKIGRFEETKIGKA